MGRRWNMGPLNTHAEFTASRINASLGPVAKTRIPVGSTFHTMEKMQPNTTAASIVNPLVVKVSTAGFIPYEASLSIRWWKYHTVAYVFYGSESGDMVAQSVVV